MSVTVMTVLPKVGFILTCKKLHLSLILLLVFSRCDEILGASTNASSVSLNLNSSYQQCNSMGASLFCLDQAGSKVCHYCANGSAVCSEMPGKGMICRNGQVYILNCYCATYNNQSNVIHFGECLYNCGRQKVETINDGYHRLPRNISELNAKICGGLHRSKTLCGRCEDTYYPMAFSYNMTCVKCPQTEWNWLRLVLFVFVPLTAFCFIILIFNINITSSYLHGFILFSQATSIPAMSRAILICTGKSRYLTFLKVLSFFYSIWNLDILRSFSPTLCLPIDPLDILTLDLVIGLYPLVLIIITHFMISLYDREYKIIRIPWEPFRRLLSRFQSHFKIKTSLIDSFATVFVLSNVKFMSVCFDLLASVNVYQLSSSSRLHYKFSLFYDATTEIYSNVARATITHLVLIVFTIFPILLLTLYPFKFFQRFLNIIPGQWHIFHTFADAFQGGYKNRSDHQEWDFRWFSSLFFILRLLVMVIYVLTLSSLFFSYAAIATVLIVLLLIILQPFKRERDNYINSGFLLLLSLLCASILGIDLAESSYVKLALFFHAFCATAAVLPLICLPILLLHWIKKIFKNEQ